MVDLKSNNVTCAHHRRERQPTAPTADIADCATWPAGHDLRHGGHREPARRYDNIARPNAHRDLSTNMIGQYRRPHPMMQRWRRIMRGEPMGDVQPDTLPVSIDRRRKGPAVPYSDGSIGGRP